MEVLIQKLQKKHNIEKSNAMKELNYINQK